MRAVPPVPEQLPPDFAGPAARARIAPVAASYLRLIGQPLVPSGGDPVEAMWRAGQVILAHGTEADPLFFFANRAGLAAFETTVAAVQRMPSRLSAEPALREERARLLAEVTTHGFIDDYAGMRISALGRRFHIAKATVWNVEDDSGNRIGQAATFAAPPHALV
jgi:hypothetical protein